MKHFYALLLFITFISSETVAQSLTQNSIRFKKDKYDLTQDAQKTLDVISDSISDHVLDRVLLKGYTDSDADSTYNALLSYRRCQTAKKYLGSKGVDTTKIFFSAYGEYFPLVENSNENNKARNRRVDIIIAWHDPLQLPKEILLKDTCHGDTMIVMAHGVLMFVNKCDYKASNPCVSADIQRNEVHHVKYSRARMKLGLKKYYVDKGSSVTYYTRITCNDTNCKSKPMTIYLPVYDVKEKNILSRTWDPIKRKYFRSKSPKIKTLKKKRYVVINFQCKGGGAGNIPLCGGMSCGQSNDCGCHPSKMKFKGGLKVIEVGAYGMAEDSISHNGTVIHFIAEYGISYLTLIDHGDTITINGLELNALKHGAGRIKACSGIKWLLFIPFKMRCEYHRKYRFSHKDIEIQQKKEWLKEEEEH